MEEKFGKEEKTLSLLPMILLFLDLIHLIAIPSDYGKVSPAKNSTLIHLIKEITIQLLIQEIKLLTLPQFYIQTTPQCLERNLDLNKNTSSHLLLFKIF